MSTFNSQGAAPFNGSIKGILLATRFRAAAPMVAVIFALLALAITLWYCHRIEKTDLRLRVAVVASLLIFASPLIEPHTWILEFLPLALITGYWIEQAPRPLRLQMWGFLAMAWILLVLANSGEVIPAINGPPLFSQAARCELI